MSEKTKILEMLSNGQITVEEASELLSAVSTSDSTTTTAPRKQKAKMVCINVFKEGSADVRVNVPIPLAKFAMRFVPDEAKIELNNQDIDITELLELMKQDLPEGKLLEVEAMDEGKPVKVLIEVV